MHLSIQHHIYSSKFLREHYSFQIQTPEQVFSIDHSLFSINHSLNLIFLVDFQNPVTSHNLVSLKHNAI